MELNKLSGTKLKMSTAYHPQTDGQSEVLNRGIELYLRSMVHEEPKKWLEILPWAELWQNSSHNESIGMTPFKALCGKEANTLIPKSIENASDSTVQSELKRREQIIELLQTNLLESQKKMKKIADLHRRDCEFEEGDWVFLKRKMYKKMSLKHHFHHKLSPRFYGHYKISKNISRVAYTLDLPQESKIHNTVHISCLKNPTKVKFPQSRDLTYLK